MFTHLHVHTKYSLLDGYSDPKELVKKAKELGMESLAITDHGVMYGVIEFYKAAKAAGIKPIIGCEVYVAPNSMLEKQGGNAEDDSRYHHLVLLVESEEGYVNLSKICTIGFTEGFYYKPRVDMEVLRKYSKGLICLSACLAGQVPYFLMNGNYQKAKQTALEYQEIFGKNNFFIELQDHGIREQREVNPQLIQIAQEIGAGLVVTNDSHYTVREENEVHDLLLCINTKSKVQDEKRMRFDTTEFYLKSEEEMRQLFPAFPEAYENTNKIAERCNFDFEFNVIHLPYYEIPKEFETHFAYFQYLCQEGLKKRYGTPIPTVCQERLDYELKVINEMGYIDYFLIVWDFINYARSKGIPVGPGRGSGAGSIAAYSVGITNVDPIKYELYFERFLNPDRVSMPDFDIDFCYFRRQEVIDYVINKYGASRVSNIITFQTMAARGAIRDVGRVLDIPYNDVDRLAKMIPVDVGMTLKKALILSADLKKEYDNNPTSKKIIDVATKLEGMPKSSSQHAAGILICDKDIVEYAPLMTSEGTQVIQFTMTTIEELGLLKFDFLGLRTLTVIDNTSKLICKNKNPNFDIEKIDITDQNVYKNLSAGNTLGSFQIEGAGLTNLMVQLEPTSIEDITAAISLYRPGPMEYIPKYVYNKKHPDEIVYDHQKLEPILSVTYGVMVYQEQVMKEYQELAGYPLSRSDEIRRAMSKKKEKIIEAEKTVFINGLRDENTNELIPDKKGNIIPGAVANGVSKEICIKLMDDMTDFSKYAFNKSHAVCYAVICYQTAFLAYYYPVEFFSSLLNSILDDNDKLEYYCNAVGEAMGITILPPDINKSAANFTPEDGKIRFGLAALKNVGLSIMELLEEERKNGIFKSFYDFALRMASTQISAKAYEALIYSGAFDFTGYNRKEMFQYFPVCVKQAALEQKDINSGQISLFSFLAPQEKNYLEPEIERVTDYPEIERLLKEKEISRLFLSGHPLNKYKMARTVVKIANIYDLKEAFEPEAIEPIYKAGDYVFVSVIILNLEKKLTKKGDTMVILTLQDLSSSMETLMFQQSYLKHEFLIKKNECVLLKLKLDSKGDKLQSNIIDVYKMPSDDESREVFEQYKAKIKNSFTAKNNNYQKAEKPKYVQPQTDFLHKSVQTKYGKGMYISISKIAEYNNFADLLNQIPGTFPVFIFAQDTNKIYTSSNMNINKESSEIMKKLVDLAGPGNIEIYN